MDCICGLMAEMGTLAPGVRGLRPGRRPFFKTFCVCFFSSATPWCTRAYEGDATTIKRALFCVGGPTPLSACERCVTVACRTPAWKSLIDGDDMYLKTHSTQNPTTVALR
jgi:hypothetical protein